MWLYWKGKSLTPPLVPDRSLTYSLKYCATTPVTEPKAAEKNACGLFICPSMETRREILAAPQLCPRGHQRGPKLDQSRQDWVVGREAAESHH